MIDTESRWKYVRFMRREDLFLKQREELIRQRRRERINNVFMAIMTAIGLAVLIYWFYLKLSH